MVCLGAKAPAWIGGSGLSLWVHFAIEGDGSVARPAIRNNLPLPATSFVGRRRQLLALRPLLMRKRMVSLLGPPGMGKTRLALELASGLRPRFPDGVWLIELAPLDKGEILPSAVAEAVGL